MTAGSDVMGANPAPPRRLCALLTCFNRVDKTLASLRALEVAAAHAGLTLSAVLVDDGSRDGTAVRVRERFPWVHVEENSGPPLFWCRGMHRAMELGVMSSPDLFLLLNDDTMLYPNALIALTECLDEAASEGSLAIAIGSTQDAVTGNHSYGGEQRRSRLRRLSFKLVPPGESCQDVDTFNGNVVLLPLGVVRKVGLMDDCFEHAMGDIDYGLRAIGQNVRLRLAVGFQGTCSNNPTGGTYNDKSLPWRKRWLLLLGRKGLPWRSWLTLAKRHGGGLWPAYFVWPYLKLIWDGVRH